MSNALAASVDVGNVVFFEHVNVNVTDKEIASEFYLTGLGLTRDPYERIGLGTMWINCGRQQIHLPHTKEPNVLRGRIILAMPSSLDKLSKSLAAVSKSLAKFNTKLAFEEIDLAKPQESMSKQPLHYLGNEGKAMRVTCPWGNEFICFEAAPWPSPLSIRGNLGMPIVEFHCPKGALPAIRHVYGDLLKAIVEELPEHTSHEVVDAEEKLDDQFSGGQGISVVVGPSQRLVFVEVDNLAAYDGYHLQLYVTDFCAAYKRFHAEGLTWNNSRFDDKSDSLELAISYFQFRFKDFVDPETKQVVYELEHEIRAVTHPYYARTLVNRQGTVGIYANQ
eukprot:TRINITY_DN4342_c0_g1_i1.p1 TRINITY_DN4342_c0_g1~~TRINITY_DN4342_c0_g1_i1.p1  ORF type:complete len:335 (+),score=82.69 TRINITY_DN4342_c0_g1_i1:38-1042(+)